MLAEIFEAKRKGNEIMLKRISKERRISPRIELELPLKIAVNGYRFETSTQNVSNAGAYCHINRYIPPFTKLAVKMILPIVNNNKKEECTVDCKGVIVRINDVAEGGFNIAIFFNEIKALHKEKISKYISQFLPKEPSCV